MQMFEKVMARKRSWWKKRREKKEGTNRQKSWRGQIGEGTIREGGGNKHVMDSREKKKKNPKAREEIKFYWRIEGKGGKANGVGVLT